jgi:hypothetical protein
MAQAHSPSNPGRLIELDLEHQGTHFQEVALDQELFAQQPNSVDECPRRAPEVTNPRCFRSDAQETVLPTDPCGIGTYVALAPATKEIFTARKGKVRAMRPSLDNAQS